MAFFRKPHVHSQKHALGGVEAESSSIRLLEIFEVQFTRSRSDLACIAKDCKIESRKCFPAILGIEDHQIPVPEPILAEPTQVFGATQSRLHEERHILTGRCLRERGLRTDG